jgi:DnaK suppressor protein
MPVTYADLRRRLEEKRQELRTQLDDMQREVREDSIGYGNHMADVGTEVFEQELDWGLARQLETTYERTKAAEAKFEDGTYGICESCGERIELARLEAMPEAPYCLDCQTRFENRR